MGNLIQQIMRPTQVDSMGVSSNIQAQSTTPHQIYNLVKPPVAYDKENRGILVEAAAEAFKNKDPEKLKKIIIEHIKPFLYEDGKVKEIPIKLLVEKRNIVRKAKAMTNEDSKKSFLTRQESSYSNIFTFKNLTETRRCFWNVEKRASLGETVLHLCFLNNTRVHTYLAKAIINIYPELLLDIYLTDDYYGENALHMAIANEDLEMTRFILKKGKKVNMNIEERCCGKFFSPTDQNETRRDRTDSETITASLTTNYKGLIYWGEHPLAFAACANHKKIFNLLIKEGANIYCQDYNGNNILHLMVIHNNKDMFNEAYEKGGKELLEMKNKQLLTPLTLAAQLANKDMLDHIMELRRSMEWVFGDVWCAKYPLTDVDTINSKDGNINVKSVLNIIMDASSRTHLSMLDGLLYQLLHEKWKMYAKRLFYQRFFLFIIYLCFFISAVVLRPTPDSTNACYLWYQPQPLYRGQIARFVFECFVLIWAIVYLCVAVIEYWYQSKYSVGVREGIQNYFWAIKNAPMKASFIISCISVICIVPCRFACSDLVETIFLTIAITTGIPYLLFFCRGFKLVGPFVTIIYNMIIGDMIRFMILYVLFLAAFSQAMYIMFRGTDHYLFSYPFSSAIGMFILTMGNFEDIYADFDTARSPLAVKGIFIVYVVVVTLLLINMLIAMMGSTFNKVSQTRWEWQRQWAKIVLVMEHAVSPEYRMRKQRGYSQPDDKSDVSNRWFVVRNFKKIET